MITETAQIIRPALAHALAEQILNHAIGQHEPVVIEQTFTEAGGKIIRVEGDEPACVEAFGICEYHTSEAYLAIYLWAERSFDSVSGMDTKNPLEVFTSLHRDTKLDDLVRLLRALCDEGLGTFVPPQDHCNDPATHLFEIDFLGVHSTGFGEFEAARNWRKAAMATISEGA